MKIHVLHENDEWLEPFAAAFEAEGLPWGAWFLDGGALDLGAGRPRGSSIHG